MCQSRFSESQVMTMLKLNESRVSVLNLCREHDMSTAMFYMWRAKFGGMDASMMKSFKELKDENRCLEKMYAEMPGLINQDVGAISYESSILPK